MNVWFDRSARMFAVFCFMVFKTVKTDEYGAAAVADDGHDGKAEAEEIHDGIRLGDDLCGGFRRNVAQSADACQKDGLAQSQGDGLGHTAD